MISIKNVSFSYADKKVLQSFSAEIAGDTPILLFGKSGRGKTTLLHLICGIIVPERGEIDAPSRVGVVFQENRLVESLSCFENCTIANGANKQKAKELFRTLAIEDCAEKLPSEVSGGQRRRVAIARALAFECEAYLLDEPFAGLDAQSKDHAIDAITQCAKGKPLVVVSHNEHDAQLLGLKTIYM